MRCYEQFKKFNYSNSYLISFWVHPHWTSYHAFNLKISGWIGRWTHWRLPKGGRDWGHPNWCTGCQWQNQGLSRENHLWMGKHMQNYPEVGIEPDKIGTTKPLLPYSWGMNIHKCRYLDLNCWVLQSWPVPIHTKALMIMVMLGNAHRSGSGNAWNYLRMIPLWWLEEVISMVCCWGRKKTTDGRVFSDFLLV